MSITINNRPRDVGQQPPEVPVDPKQAQAPGKAQGQAQAEGADKTKAGPEGPKGKDDAKTSAASLNAAASVKSKDVLVVDEKTIEVLSTLQGSKIGVEGDAVSVGAELFAKLKAQLDKPNGLEVPEAFAHRDLATLSELPFAPSGDEVAILRDLPQSAPSFAEALADLLSPPPPDAPPLPSRAQLVATILTKLEKLQNAGLPQDLAPKATQTPAFVAQTLAKSFPQIFAAVQHAIKSQEMRFQAGDGVEIPGPHVLEVEKALGTLKADLLALADDLKKVSAQDWQIVQKAYGQIKKTGKHEYHLSEAQENLLAKLKPSVLQVKPLHPGPKQIQIPNKDLKQIPMPGASGGSSGSQQITQPADQGGFVNPQTDDVIFIPGEGNPSAFDGFDIMTADIDAAIQFVLAQCQAFDTDELRDQLDEMKKMNVQKQAQRDKIAHMREAKAELDNKMHEEFNTLKAAGELGEDVTYDQYAAERQVAWDIDENGNVSAQLVAGWDVPASLGPKPDKDGDGSGLGNIGTSGGLGNIGKAGEMHKVGKGGLLDNIGKAGGIGSMKVVNLGGGGGADPQQDAIDKLPSAQGANAAVVKDSQRHLEETKQAILEIAVLEMLVDLMPAPVSSNLKKLLDEKKKALGKELGGSGFMLKEHAQELYNWQKTQMQGDVQAQINGFIDYLDAIHQAAKQMPGKQSISWGNDGPMVGGCPFSKLQNMPGYMKDPFAPLLNQTLQPQPNIIDQMLRQGTFMDMGTKGELVGTSAMDIHVETSDLLVPVPVAWDKLWDAAKHMNAEPGPGPYGYPQVDRDEAKKKDAASDAAKNDAERNAKEKKGIVIKDGDTSHMKRVDGDDDGAHKKGDKHIKIGHVGNASGGKFVKAGDADKDGGGFGKLGKAGVLGNIGQVGGGAGQVDGSGKEAPPADTTLRQQGTLAQMQAAMDTERDKLDSMSELSDMAQLRLQMLMDRHKKVIDMRTNLMKSASQIAETISQNMK